ncbi:hypothetical protein ACH5RR_021477 [Cinchona calisaya]|uniref:Uncharacterized protein n=1 Tax=Cinchona calisaya TaxID=153742 RepID=A0ABD2ZIM5_9GENT
MLFKKRKKERLQFVGDIDGDRTTLVLAGHPYRLDGKDLAKSMIKSTAKSDPLQLLLMENDNSCLGLKGERERENNMMVGWTIKPSSPLVRNRGR